MTARKPLVPPELLELLTLMSQLTAPLPLPASSPGSYVAADWDARRDAAERRSSLAWLMMSGLVVSIEAAGEYPVYGADILADCYRRDSGRLREELARPLGYEPAAPLAPEPGR